MKYLNIGGSEVFTYNEIAERALKIENKPIKISKLPTGPIKVILPVMRLFTSSKTDGPHEFLMTVLTGDVVGKLSGEHTQRILLMSIATGSI